MVTTNLNRKKQGNFMTDPAETVLITGVSSGIGKALAVYFKEKGVRVIGVSRRQPEINVDLWICADLTAEEGREKIYQETLKFTGGSLNLLLNNAGVGIYSTWEEMQEEDLRKTMELDFFAVVLLTRKMLPLLKNTPKASVINISSSASRIWVPCMGAYCAAKAAVSMFSNSLRPELTAYGIHVGDVMPGQISTGFSSRSFGSRRPPNAPGAKNNASGLAAAVYRVWRRRKKTLFYPGWLGAGMFFIRNFIPGIYDAINCRLWKLR